MTSAKAKNRSGPCRDCGAVVAYTKAGRPYPAHRASKRCLDRQTCTCGHFKDKHADEQHECSARDPGEEGGPFVQCGCSAFKASPFTSSEQKR